MIHGFAILMAIAGFACLCAAMARHQKDVFGRKLAAPAARRVRITGGALLLCTLTTDILGLGAAYGAVAWCGHLSAAAALVLTGLNWRVARGAGS